MANHFEFSTIVQVLPDIGKRVSKLEEEVAMLDASGEVNSFISVGSQVVIVVYFLMYFIYSVFTYRQLSLNIIKSNLI